MGETSDDAGRDRDEEIVEADGAEEHRPRIAIEPSLERLDDLRIVRDTDAHDTDPERVGVYVWNEDERVWELVGSGHTTENAIARYLAEVVTGSILAAVDAGRQEVGAREQ